MEGIFSKAAILVGLVLSTITSALPHTPTMVGDSISRGFIATGVDSIITVNVTADNTEGGLISRTAGAAGPARDVLKTVKGILDQVKRDNKNRERFTQEMISSMRSEYPSFNFVICHTRDEY